MEVVLLVIVAAVAIYLVWPSSEVDEVTPQPEPEPVEVPNLGKMTKVQIEEWAKENLDIDLDRRMTKANMIADIKSRVK